MMDARTRRSKCRGFTYLWVLFVVALMGVGVMAMAEVYKLQAMRDRERELLFIGHQFRAAIASYYESRTSTGDRQYPRSLDDLLKDPRSAGVRRHLRRLYPDPITGRPEWGLVIVNGGVAGVHSLSEATPLKVSGFDPEDASFRDARMYREWKFTYPADLLLRPDPGTRQPSWTSPASSPEGSR